MSGFHRRFLLVLAGLAAVTGPALASPASTSPELASKAALTVDEVIERHLAARGGERWDEVGVIEARGTYAAFSDYEPFALSRAPGDLYRLEFSLLGGTAIRARDAKSAWWQHPLLQAEPSRLEAGPYQALVERESVFGPLLARVGEGGVSVKLVGPAEVEGAATLELLVTLPSGAEETWFLDAETFLEFAIDSTVNDFTQSAEALKQRAFLDDFRTVEGLVIPFQIDYEFGHRLESMTIESLEVGMEADSTKFAFPETAAAD